MREMPLLENLSDPEIDQLREIGDLRELAAGTVLIREGERADNAYLLVSGAARVEIDGQEIGTSVTAGECVGELAVLDEAPRAATVTVTAPTVVIAFTGESFRGALERMPALREAVTRALSRRLRQASTGWAQLAVDTDVLLDAYFVLQGSADDRDRHSAIQAAAALLGRLAEVSDERAALDRLTPAEQRVAACVAKGLSNARVAAELFVSEHTVASHLKHIYAKLGVSSRVGLATAVLRTS